MAERYNAWAVTGTAPERAVQIVRNYDGRVFAMSSDEARALAAQLAEAADRDDARKGQTGPKPVSAGADDSSFVSRLEASTSVAGSLARAMRRQGAPTEEIAQQFSALRKLAPEQWGSAK